MKSLQKMLKLYLILQIMNYVDHYLQEKIKRLFLLMKDKLDKKNHDKFVALSARIYNYLIDDSSEDKKSKRHKKLCHKDIDSF